MKRCSRLNGTNLGAIEQFFYFLFQNQSLVTTRFFTSTLKSSRALIRSFSLSLRSLSETGKIANYVKLRAAPGARERDKERKPGNNIEYAFTFQLAKNAKPWNIQNSWNDNNNICKKKAFDHFLFRKDFFAYIRPSQHKQKLLFLY